MLQENLQKADKNEKPYTRAHAERDFTDNRQMKKPYTRGNITRDFTDNRQN